MTFDVSTARAKAKEAQGLYVSAHLGRDCGVTLEKACDHIDSLERVNKLALRYLDELASPSFWSWVGGFPGEKELDKDTANEFFAYAQECLFKVATGNFEDMPVNPLKPEEWIARWERRRAAVGLMMAEFGKDLLAKDDKDK